MKTTTPIPVPLTNQSTTETGSKIISKIDVSPINNGLGMHSHTKIVFSGFSDDVEDTEILIYPHEYDSIKRFGELYKQRRNVVEVMMKTTIRHAALMRKQCDLFMSTEH
jgi:hypothetical protein